LPKADLRLIALFIILFLSCLLPVVQYQKYQSAIKYLTQATINNLGLKSGGTKQTLELYRRAIEQYEIQIKTSTYTYLNSVMSCVVLTDFFYFLLIFSNILKLILFSILFIRIHF